MATKKLFILFSILLSMVGTKAWAYDIAVENADGVTIYYNYITDGKELEVTYLINDYYTHYFYSESVVIPEEVTYMNRTRKVTSIGDYAFRYCSDLTSITIPNSVTSIGKEAFSSCYDLTSITIPNSVTNIGESAFVKCSGLTSITIPNSVTNIEERAFASCSGLTSVAIGNGVASIGKSAFYGCKGLSSVHISDLESWCKISFAWRDSNPLYFARRLYLNGEEIKDFVIPNSVTSIGKVTFYNCYSLKSVIIPNSVTSIGDSTFMDCGLTSVTIGNVVTSIGRSAFEGCKGLTSITIPNSVKSIEDYAFKYCSGLKSVTIGNGVTSIGYCAFSGWDLPEVISKIENPFNIDEGTFSNNTYLNASLYVLAGTIDKYKATEGWNKFVFIEEGTESSEEDGGDDTPETKKCEKPTISFKDGKLVFSCATDGVSYQYNITASSVSSGTGNNIDFTPKYTITVYATKDGYEDSDTATLEVSASDTANGDMNGDGVIDAADIVKIVNIIMEQNE